MKLLPFSSPPIAPLIAHDHPMTRSNWRPVWAHLSPRRPHVSHAHEPGTCTPQPPLLLFPHRLPSTGELSHSSALTIFLQDQLKPYVFWSCGPLIIFSLHSALRLSHTMQRMRRLTAFHVLLLTLVLWLEGKSWDRNHILCPPDLTVPDQRWAWRGGCREGNLEPEALWMPLPDFSLYAFTTCSYALPPNTSPRLAPDPLSLFLVVLLPEKEGNRETGGGGGVQISKTELALL